MKTTQAKHQFNGTWAPMQSPDYWLFDHELSDWNPKVGYSHAEAMTEMTYFSRPKSLRLGNRNFIVKVLAGGVGSMVPLQ